MPPQPLRQATGDKLFNVQQVGRRDVFVPKPEAFLFAKGAEVGNFVKNARGEIKGLLKRARHLEPRLVVLPMDRVHPRHDQPRQQGKAPEEAEKRGSIEQLSPAIVIPYDARDGRGTQFQVIDGERRYWRTDAEGKQEILSSVIWDPNADRLYALAVVLNVDRKQLNIIEEARAYKKLVDIECERNAELTPDQAIIEVAKAARKEFTEVKESLAYLTLDPQIQSLVQAGRLGKTAAKKLMVQALQPHQKRLGEELAKAAKRLKPKEQISTADVERIIRRVTAVKVPAGSPNANGHSSPAEQASRMADRVLVSIARARQDVEALERSLAGTVQLPEALRGVVAGQAEACRQKIDAFLTTVAATNGAEDEVLRQAIAALRVVQAALGTAATERAALSVRLALHNLIARISRKAVGSGSTRTAA